MTPKQLRLKDNLEPENGDFVRFLADIERLQQKDFKGLLVTLPENGSGMVTVSSNQELATLPSSTSSSSTIPVSVAPQPMPDRSPADSRRTSLREPSSLASLIYTIAGPVLVLGAVMTFVGVNMNFEPLIPLGMFCMFAGVVGWSEGQKEKKRRRNARMGR